MLGIAMVISRCPIRNEVKNHGIIKGRLTLKETNVYVNNKRIYVLHTNQK